jgi:hypothetical protein
MPDTTLVILWLVLAHLVADFVLQNDWIALNKASGTAEGRRALATHGLHVSLCLLPAVVAFGLPGLVYLVVVAVSHMFVDRWKVQATRRADAAAQAAALARWERQGGLPESGLGAAWSPWPGMLFLADQLLHMTFALVGWLVILGTVPLTGIWLDFVNLLFRGFDKATVHAVLVSAVVFVSVFLVNTRGAYYFVMALASPRDLKSVPGPDGSPVPAPAPAPNAVPVGASYRIEATVSAIERLLIVAFVLLGSALAAAGVVALRVAARWRQLADRGYAEYFLVATLGSVAVAVASALLAAGALATLS